MKVNRKIEPAKQSNQKTTIHSGMLQFKDQRPAAHLQQKIKQLSNNSDNIVQAKANNSGLPSRLKSGIENLSGYSMDDVKVHYNSSRPAQLQAHAFAQGNNIHLASGQEKHLPHEAWHVVQQKQGRVQATKQLRGKENINDDEGLEKEADVMGEKALQQNSSENTQLKQNEASSSVKQLKVGVEYETKWKIEGTKADVHKKKIFKGSGWHLESDANYLEFVVDPPVGKASDLKSKSGLMAATAAKIKSNDNKSAKTILGSTVEDDFKDKVISKGGADSAMSAKAQFTFGISMAHLTNFLNVLGSGKMPEGKYDEASKKFGFEKNKDMTTREFLSSTVKGDVSNSNTYRTKLTSISKKGGQSDELKGFLSYLGYYVKSMEKEYTEDSGDLEFTKTNKTAFLGQEIIKKNKLKSDETLAAIAKSLKYSPDLVGTLEYLASTAELEVTTKAKDVPLADITKIDVFVKGRLEDKASLIDYPKYRFTLMNRSGFDKMYQELGASDQKWFKENISEVIKSIGREADSFLFNSPYTYKTKDKKGKVKERGLSAGPTIEAWLKSIVASTKTKRDSLSPPKEFIDENGDPDPDQSMGSLGFVDTSKVTRHRLTSKSVDSVRKDASEGVKGRAYSTDKQVQEIKQVVIELRNWGDFVKPEDWANHSYDMAFLHNQISSGELESELELEYQEEKAKIMNQIEELKKKKYKNMGGNKGQRQHKSNFNKGINNQIAYRRGALELLSEKYKVGKL